jgi:Rod binding domain-containing protein
MTPLQMYNLRARETKIPPGVHKTEEARKLKESCQQFESILWAQIWKKMRADARQIGDEDERERPWKQMEDLSLEMASEEIVKSGGTGLWKVLYDQLVPQVAAKMKSVESDALNG